jgi:hypothetical protein
MIKEALYQVEQGTFTPKRSDMFGTPNKGRPSAVPLTCDGIGYGVSVTV